MSPALTPTRTAPIGCKSTSTVTVSDVSSHATPGRPDVDDAACADEKAWSNPMGQPFDKSQDLWWSQQQDAAIKVKALSRWNNYCTTADASAICFVLPSG